MAWHKPLTLSCCSSLPPKKHKFKYTGHRNIGSWCKKETNGEQAAPGLWRGGMLPQISWKNPTSTVEFTCQMLGCFGKKMVLPSTVQLDNIMISNLTNSIHTVFKNVSIAKMYLDRNIGYSSSKSLPCCGSGFAGFAPIAPFTPLLTLHAGAKDSLHFYWHHQTQNKIEYISIVYTSFLQTTRYRHTDIQHTYIYTYTRCIC